MIFSRSLLSTILAGALCACTTTKLVEPAQAPSTERVVFAEGNRVFFVGGSTLYELVSKPDGTREVSEVMKREDCMLIGLVAAGSKLYMTCAAFGVPSPEQQAAGFPPTTRTDLIRLDLRKSESDPARVSAAALEGPGFFPNGMAMDRSGALYISNSYSAVASLLTMETHPAIIRVRILNGKSFQIESAQALSASDGGQFPNGIQIEGDRLWLVSANSLYEMKIGRNGLENAHTIYTRPPSRMMDDFAVLPNHILAVTDIAMPGTSDGTSDTASRPPLNEPSQLIYLEVGSGADIGETAEVVWTHDFDYPTTPSSAASIVDARGPALLVTDYFFGGLYRVGL